MTEGVFAGRRVLIVEDEYFIAEELARALQSTGAVALGPVPSVEAALDLLERGDAPDAAILDLNLGGEMAGPIADTLEARGVPFLFTTGYSRASLPARHAAARHLEKPVDAKTVLREVGRLLAPASSES